MSVESSEGNLPAVVPRLRKAKRRPGERALERLGKPGPAKGYKYETPTTQLHRDRIAQSNILRRLIDCAEGKLDMSTAQSQVGIALMRKVLPDLAQQTISGDDAKPITLQTIITGVVRRTDTLESGS